MKCERCSATSNLTRDHVIPKWAFKRRRFLLGKRAREFRHKVMQVLCTHCNNRKCGFIDVSHPEALRFWLDVREEINRVINETLGTGDKVKRPRYNETNDR